MSDIYHVAAPGVCLGDCVSKGHDCCPTLHTTQQNRSATSVRDGNMSSEVRGALRINRVASVETVTW